jgi:hypothetical protein
MTVCWFAQFRHPVGRLSNDELTWLRRFVAGTPGLRQGLIFTPSTTSDPYLHDGAPPLLGLQLYFDDIAGLEAALTSDGYLQDLVGHDALPSLADATATAGDAGATVWRAGSCVSHATRGMSLHIPGGL